MDFKALRAAKNKKAQGLTNSSGGKVDSSDWTPDEPLDADVKTGMRPISRRAFKTGGKVDGEAAKTNLSRAPRGNIGLANTNQRVANEERDGEKHVGGFKSGGRTGKNNGGPSLNQYGKPITQSDLDRYASTTEQTAPSKLAPKTSIRPMTRSDAEAQRMLDSENDGMPMKRGGKAEKFEGSAKDEAQDKKLAAKRGVSMKEWEASDADAKHDKQKSMKGLKHGGKADDDHDEGCTCKACGGRMGRATGGRAKGKTNIVINVMPHSGSKPAAGIQPPMPPVGGPPPMGGGMPPPPMHMPPGLGAALAGAAGAGPMPPPGGPGAGPMPPPGPMMARKDGGKVYPKMKFGAGSGKGRLEKIDKYGKNA